MTGEKKAAPNLSAQSRPQVNWLAPPKKHPYVLGLLAILYLVWLVALGWLAVQTQRGG